MDGARLLIPLWKWRDPHTKQLKRPMNNPHQIPEEAGFYYRKISKVQTEGMDHRNRRVFGMLRLQWHGGDNYSVRKLRAKK